MPMKGGMAMYDTSTHENFAYLRVSRPEAIQAVPSFSAPPSMADDVYDINANLPGALELITKAVEGETEDRLFYQYLISQAPTQQERDVIGGIRDDEMKHYLLFRQIYQELTGNALTPTAETPFEKPASYCDGLHRALMGEQSAVTRYRRILYAMKDRRHINMLTEIITDELRHLGLYNYLYSKNQCKA
jgi:rubrerythrin